MADPVKVSSLIKVTRYSLLSLGIFWGYSRNKVLSVQEAKFREEEEAARPAREAAIKTEKDRINKAEMEYLGRETGVLSGGGGGKSGGGKSGGGGSGSSSGGGGSSGGSGGGGSSGGGSGGGSTSSEVYQGDCGCRY